MRSLWPVLAVALCLPTASCGGSHPAPVAPTPRPTSISQLDSAAMQVVRVAFCDLVPKASVRAALAAAPLRARSWRSGDPVPDAGGQLGHEFGCAWFGPHGRVVRAWVFARPVTAAYAETLVRRTAAESGCQAARRTDFGRPAVLQTCTHGGAPTRVRRAGLFGGTWLTCEVSGAGPVAALRARADAWCLSTANSLNAGPGAG